MMKSTTVIDSKGRAWTVSRKLEWSLPPIGEDFEHDLDGGRGAAFLVLSVLVVFVVGLFVWRPDKVVDTWWLWVAGVAVVAFFLVRWLVRRPWTLVAATPGGYDEEAGAEHWVGTVRGYWKAREELGLISRGLRSSNATPTYSYGPMRPVS